MPEDGLIMLGPVDVRFGDGSSVVQGTVQCSVGTFELGGQIANGEGGDVFVLEGRGDWGEEAGRDTVALRGPPSDVAKALSMVTYSPPKDWSSRAHGVATLSMEIQATENLKVKEVNNSSGDTISGSAGACGIEWYGSKEMRPKIES